MRLDIDMAEGRTLSSKTSKNREVKSQNLVPGDDREMDRGLGMVVAVEEKGFARQKWSDVEGMIRK